MATDKQHKIPNAPNLRFPEFEGEWKESLLQDVATLSKGAGISKEQLSKEGNPCILYGELYTKYNSEVITEIYSRTNIDLKNLVLSKKNDVIIPSSGETAIDISTARCVPFDNIFLGGDLNIIRLNGHDGRFLSYQLNGVRRLDIAKVAQGVSVVHLYGENLRRLKVRFPRKEEQEKIAAFMTVIDARIQTQIGAIEKIESLISCLYDKLFQTETGETKPLKGICQIRKGKQVNSDQLSERGEYYVMNGGITPSGYWDKFNAESGTISISEGGNSCGYVQYNEYRFWSGGHCYTLHPDNKRILTKYLFHYLKYRQQDIMALRTGSGLPNIQKKDLENYRILITSFAKQMHISEILDSFYSKLDIERRLLEQYRLQKQYLLSQMFV